MKTQDVRTYTEQRLRRLQTLPDNQRRAELAKLRRGVGHRPGELPELWGSFLLGMPEGFQGNNGPTAAEWAVYLALTLYAVHQQGNDQPMNRPHSTLGRAVRQLAERNTSAGQDWTEASVLRRFNALATAEEITEISHHLRGMIQLLSAAKDGAIPLDYPQLAVDLHRPAVHTDPRQRPSAVGPRPVLRNEECIVGRGRKGELIMKKRLYVDFHVLQTVPPSCINRDDTGSPKTAVYGGVLRARVSSQAWKHAMRKDFAENTSLDVGKRTKKAAELVKKQILALDSELDADKLAKKALENTGIKSDDKGTKALFFMSTAQAKALAVLAVEGVADKKQYKDALKAAPSMDMALFGRMVADDPSLNYDAAAQVAHSISTHAVKNEYDYFTAVDDCQTDSTGAGHLGTVEYNSSTLYRYATVNVMELKGKLGAEQAAETVRAFGEAFLFSMPTGKQNTFANRTLPDAVYVTIREDQPVNLCGAFERAVSRGEQGGYAEASKAALAQYAQQVYASFVEAPAQSFTVGSGLEALAPAQTAKAMLDALEKAVRDALSGNEVE